MKLKNTFEKTTFKTINCNPKSNKLLKVLKNAFLLIAIVLISSLTTQSFASAKSLKGDTSTEFGKYTLTPSENCVVIGNKAYKTWDLVYSGSDVTYQVISSVKEDGQCCFMVRSENFEIQYANQSSGFGVKLVDVNMRSIKKKDVMKQIDYDKYVSQMILTTKVKTEAEYLGLVACFMPLLFS